MRESGGAASIILPKNQFPRGYGKYLVRLAAGGLLLAAMLLSAPLLFALPADTILPPAALQPDSREDHSCLGPNGKTTGRTEPEPDGIKPNLQDNRVSGPYCGINSLYICLSSLGINTDLCEYITTRYVGSFQGSSAEELVRAAEGFGAKGTCYSHLTHRELKRIHSPAILHMRSNWADGGYNHWVAFLGFERGRIRIVDPPHPLQTISPAELLANWDGTAVVISKENVDATFLAAARIDYFLIVGLILLAAFLLRNNLRITNHADRDSSWLVRLHHLLPQSAVIFALAVGLGLVFHACSDIGFLSNPTALAEVKRRYYSVDIPELTIEETIAEIDRKNPLVLDTRRVRDFRRGSLPGAESMSLFSSLPERQEVLAGVPKSKRLIVFCQSAGCDYADEIAKFLEFNGYENLAIYREGYREWKEEKVEPETEKANPSPD